MTTFGELKLYISDFQWRLSESITLDYGKLDEQHQEKTRFFCYGFAIAKGALAAVNTDKHNVSISHSYMERVLVKAEDKRNLKKEFLKVREWHDMETAFSYLIDGICTTVDYSECRTELAKAIFNALGGLLFGLTGDINKITNNVFEYKPQKKRQMAQKTKCGALVSIPVRENCLAHHNN